MINDERDIESACNPIVKTYHVRAPDKQEMPYMVFQQVGGRPSNTICGNTDKQNARFRFTLFHSNSIEGAKLLRRVEKILTDPPIRAVSLGSLTSGDDLNTRRKTSHQDFSVWFGPPSTP